MKKQMMLILGMILAAAGMPLQAMRIIKHFLNERLIKATHAANTNKIITLINWGADVNYQDEYTRTRN